MNLSLGANTSIFLLRFTIWYVSPLLFWNMFDFLACLILTASVICLDNGSLNVSMNSNLKSVLSQIDWHQIKLYNMTYSRKYSNDMFYDNHYQFDSVHGITCSLYYCYFNIYLWLCCLYLSSSVLLVAGFACFDSQEEVINK